MCGTVTIPEEHLQVVMYNKHMQMSNVVALYICIQIHVCMYVCMYVCIRTQTNVGTFKCLFVYVTFISRVFAPKHSLIVFIPDLCANFIQKVTLLL